MMFATIVDLDELVLKCRDDKAREYIWEAIASYKSGAFRSAIVSTWIAVVYDIVSKLSELELTGDKKAKKHLEDYERIVAGGESKLKEALDFERGILEMAATDFDLLTSNELLDLNRLKEDRNRCAHPSMQAIGNVYVPSPELARTHIRNSVDLLLSREPVQGKAAFDRICVEVSSEYFPVKLDDAVNHFKTGPLVRARLSLIRDLVLGFTKAIINDDKIDIGQRHRLGIALGAIAQLHNAKAEKVLTEELPKIIWNISDEKIWRIIYISWLCPPAWRALGDVNQKKVTAYLKAEKPKGLSLVNALTLALYVPDLEKLVIDRAGVLDKETLSELLSKTNKNNLSKLSSLIPNIIKGAFKVGSYRSAEKYYEDFILPLAPILTPDNIDEVLRAIRENDQAYCAGAIPNILVKLYDATPHNRSKDKEIWSRFMAELKKLKFGIDYSELEQRLFENGIINDGHKSP